MGRIDRCCARRRGLGACVGRVGRAMGGDVRSTRWGDSADSTTPPPHRRSHPHDRWRGVQAGHRLRAGALRRLARSGRLVEADRDQYRRPQSELVHRPSQGHAHPRSGDVVHERLARALRNAGTRHSRIDEGQSDLARAHSVDASLTSWTRAQAEGHAFRTRRIPRRPHCPPASCWRPSRPTPRRTLSPSSASRRPECPRRRSSRPRATQRPSIAMDGTNAWVVIQRVVDGALVSCGFTPSTRWAAANTVEIAQTVHVFVVQRPARDRRAPAPARRRDARAPAERPARCCRFSAGYSSPQTAATSR